jgi:pimeloyl-ACP methyl ester carboxylesterase
VNTRRNSDSRYTALDMNFSTFFVLVLVATTANAQSGLLNHPVTTDPEIVNEEYPPAMIELTFESEGSRLNGLVYLADGPGPHPLVLLLHGFPGNEKNLDLAQAMRRSGVNVVFFHYRGSWGSGGEFGFANSVKDVANVLAMVRDSTWAVEHRSDPSKVGIVGHSFGSFLGAKTVEGDGSIACFANLDGWDVGAYGLEIRGNEEVIQGVITSWESGEFGEGGPLRGEVASVVTEFVDQAESYSFESMSPSLAQVPLLIISASRAFGATHDSLVTSIREAGAKNITEYVLDDDHSFSAHRIELAQLLVDWQSATCWN